MAARSQRILYGGTGGADALHQGSVLIADTQTKRTHEVLSLSRAQIVNFTISPDNRTIYFSFDRVEGDIWLATFQGATPARLPGSR